MFKLPGRRLLEFLACKVDGVKSIPKEMALKRILIKVSLFKVRSLAVAFNYLILNYLRLIYAQF